MTEEKQHQERRKLPLYTRNRKPHATGSPSACSSAGLFGRHDGDDCHAYRKRNPGGALGAGDAPHHGEPMDKRSSPALPSCGTHQR